MTTNNVTIAEGGNLDRIGMITSCVCAVHCAVMPAVVGLLPLLGLGVIADESVEWALVIFAALVGTASLLPTYFRHHRRATPLVTFAAGLMLISFGKMLFEERATLETAFVVSGALAVAFAHFLNRRLCRECCEPPANS